LIQLLHARFHFLALDEIRFPRAQAGNTIRGMLGDLLRALPCVEDCASDHPPGVHNCAYARIFKPLRSAALPPGYGDPPRPFAIRTAHLDGLRVARAGTFFFDIHLFAPQEIDSITSALRGFNVRGARAEMVKVETKHIPLSLDRDEIPVAHCAVHFETPTELKHPGPPEFHVLFKRVRDRVSALNTLYGREPLDVDFQQLGQLAESVKLVTAQLQHHSRERTSSRTGQTHPIGGFTGIVEYAGELAPFIPWLRVAEWTGVGRQTTWGKGCIRLSLVGLHDSDIAEIPV
jgi:Uncharacterized conserved protein (DUF2276).